MSIKWDIDCWKSSEKEASSTCKHGHPWTVLNTGYYGRKGRAKPDKKYRVCKTCRVLQYKLKYHSDPEFRNRAIQRGIARYHNKKAQNGLGQVP